MARAILLTGNPGCGKTTLIRRVLSHLSLPASGFYTQEIRLQGKRQGFELITLDGRRGLLAHIDIRGSQRIGKYGVDIRALEALGVGAIEQAISEHRIAVIDEIGPMEILSERFRQAVMQALNSDVVLLGSIVRRSNPFTDQIKAMPGITLLEVRPDNREGLLPWIVRWLEGQAAA